MWNEENRSELVENLENPSVTPFLGALILKEVYGNEFSIIDGQQRLTTITVLAKAIYDSLPEYAKEQGSGVRNGVENFLFYRNNAADDFEDSHIKIEHSKVDKADYAKIIRAAIFRGEDKIDLDTVNENSSNVLKCYKYYRERFSTYSVQELKELFTLTFDRKRKVLIVIELDKDDASEQTIFDTINRAGVRLSAADIIKNNLFKRLLDESGGNEELRDRVIKTYQECWDEVFSQTKEIFCIELYRRRDDAVDVNALEYKYTIEHIMPKKWCTHWADVPIVDENKILDCESEEGVQFRKRAIESIGNKTLLTCNLNSALKNASYGRKVLGDGEKKPGYKLYTMLLLTKDIVENYETDKVWDEKHIDARAEKLYEEFLCIWPSYCAEVNRDEIVVVESNDGTDPDLSAFTEEELADPIKVFAKVSVKNERVDVGDTADISDMYSQLELIKHISLNSTHTIRKYIAEGKIVPDAVVRASDKRYVNYYRKERVTEYAEKYGWEIINDDNITNLFPDMITKRRMDHSYKPVFLKCFFDNCNSSGTANITDIADEFNAFYIKRRDDGLTVEKSDSIFCKENYSADDVKKQILNHPYKRFEMMNMMEYDEITGEIMLNKTIWKQLSARETEEIRLLCDMGIERYYESLSENIEGVTKSDN